MTNEEKILEMLGQVLERQDRMESELSGVKGELSSVKATQEQMQGELSSVKAAQERMEARQERMEEAITGMQTTLTRVAVTQENVIIPNIKLLAEGHAGIMDALVPKERVERIEEDVDALKLAVKSHSRQIAELQEAQQG